MTRAFLTLAKIAAILGGIVLTFLILLTVVSVTGRGLNTLGHFLVNSGMLAGVGQGMLDAGVGPVMGDFELVEAGVAFCIFAFLPLAQITGAHATVDILTMQLPAWVTRVLSMIWEVLFAVVLIVIAWKLYEGMAGKMRYNETTMLLQFPVWWSYALSLSGAVIAAVVAVYVAAARVSEVVTGRVILHAEGGAH
ncbi:TRAP transporter small permease [Pseudooceanicola onchidii]|uniref:TRAP transporter small permease n=1 Tax=Pseudooceanicola onchidii TaxID=2562279 RepID=UPI0010AAA145|nr:TRAP transporter small permease [Pseudooceanicola onchidii]